MVRPLALVVCCALPALGCASPKTVVEIPPCADRVDVTGQAQRLGPRRFELDHTFDLVLTKSELTFEGRGGTETLVLVNDRPDALRAVVAAGLAGVGALLLGSAWWEVNVAGRSPLEAQPFYQALGGAGFTGVGVLLGITGWHPARSYVQWEGPCPAGDAAPSLEVRER